MAVFWVVAPCSLVEIYQRFRGPCCLHHQGDEAARSSEKLVNFYPWKFAFWNFPLASFFIQNRKKLIAYLQIIYFGSKVVLTNSWSSEADLLSSRCSVNSATSSFRGKRELRGWSSLLQSWNLPTLSDTWWTRY
jgi:hypothetical protein